MVRFINALTGSVMWVHEDRAEEYLAAGHKPAPETEAPVSKSDTGASSKTAGSGKKTKK